MSEPKNRHGSYKTPSYVSLPPFLPSYNTWTMNALSSTTTLQTWAPEVSSLDARIANSGGTTSGLELQPHRLRQAKRQNKRSISQREYDLVRENGYLRQEIAFYQESRNAMMAFHHQSTQAYEAMQQAFRELSEKMAMAEERLDRYWGIALTKAKDRDLTVL